MGIFIPISRTKAKIASKWVIAGRVYLTTNPVILNIKPVFQVRCSLLFLRAHKFYKNFEMLCSYFFMIILKASFYQIFKKDIPDFKKDTYQIKKKDMCGE